MFYQTIHVKAFRFIHITRNKAYEAQMAGLI